MAKRVGVILDWPYSMIPMPYVMSLFASDIMSEPNRVFIRVGSPHADVGANASIKHALENGCEEIFFCSADQTVPPDILTRFRAHKKPIVAALTASRSQAGHPWLLYEYTIDGRFMPAAPIGGLQRAGYVGPGCMLVQRKVFEKMSPPWFYTTATPDGCNVLITNDFHFFKDAAAAGIEVYCDSSVVSDHWHEIALNAQSLGRNIPRIEVVDNRSAEQVATSGISMPNGHSKA